MANHAINFELMEQLTGGVMTCGYVPDARNKYAGVNIASGFDLGNQSFEALKALGFPLELRGILLPYLGQRGDKAQQILKWFPLRVSKESAETIDSLHRDSVIKHLVCRYDEVSEVPFERLPECAQTVIASAAFQFADLERNAPELWRHVIRQDWKGAVSTLYACEDFHPLRRHREADWLKRICW